MFAARAAGFQGMLAVYKRHTDECMQVQQEDIALCEAVQRGLRSPAYDSGRCAPTTASDLDGRS